MSYVQHLYSLPSPVKKEINQIKPPFGFGLVGEVVFYRTYSRLKENGTSRESWSDVVIRCIEGTWSIIKDHMIKQHLPWKEKEWQDDIRTMALDMAHMKWIPPGRGLWGMGPLAYKKGGAVLANCAAISSLNLIESLTWAMSMLMCGCGVGFDTDWAYKKHNEIITRPDKSCNKVFVVPDSREGWVESVQLLLSSYIGDTNNPPGPYYVFDYSKIRAAGTPIKTFGGTACGPQPLQKLHQRIEAYLNAYIGMKLVEKIKENQRKMEVFDILINDLRETDFSHLNNAQFETMQNQIHKHIEHKTYDATRLVVDLFNAVGACVVAGGVRRSSMLALCRNPGDDTFVHLKDYDLNPERVGTGYMSNNSVEFSETSQYTKYLPDCTKLTQHNGEPGYFFRLNVERYGRIRPHHGDHHQSITRETELDKATIPNPCSEIPLENGELCILAELIMNNMIKNNSGKHTLTDLYDIDTFKRVCKWALIYAKAVTLLPTHSPMTNAVIARNRRVGVSITGVAQVIEHLGITNLTALLRTGYRVVRETDVWFSKLVGVPQSIRVTTCKPSGTVSLMTGSTPGVHYPVGRYLLRRIRISNNDPIVPILQKAGLEWEKDQYADSTLCFSFYMDNGPVRAQKDVPLYEQLAILATMQREWSDNMVSVTATFDKEKERHLLEGAVAQFAPVIKSVSFLPLSKDVYAQMPNEEIEQGEYNKKKGQMHINWQHYTAEVEMPKGCSNDVCLK